MKKKLLIALLAIAAAICCTFGFAACGGDETPGGTQSGGNQNETSGNEQSGGNQNDSHVHDWGEWEVTTPATCSAQGEETRTCKLDSAHKETRATAIDPNAHGYGTLIQVQPATCIQKGTIAHYHCVCGKYFNEAKEEISEAQLEIAIDSTAHRMIHVEAKAATCTAKGWNAYDICELCGENDRVETDIDQNAHDYDTDNICKNCKTPLKYCEDLTYKIDGQTCTVTGVTSYFRDKEVVLPHFYNKIPITAIGESAFNNHRSITSVIIPDSVTYIGKMAFADCSSLANINMPDGVTYIGYGAFGGCSKLADINIPDGVNYIGELAFSGCKSLESITIPDGVTSIGRLTFNGCEKLQSITIPDSVTSIGEGAFISCNSLKSIAIPASVTSIGNDVFSNSKYIESITFGDNSKLETIGDRTFNECTRLTNFIIPDGVTSIGESAFAYCQSLKSINIPDSVTSIGEKAFRSCDNLKSITVGEKNKAYSSQDGVLYNKDKTLLIRYFDSVTSINIADSVTAIGKYAFSGLKGITSITIPEGITSIEEGAFDNCWYLKSAEIPASVTTIERNIFYGCEKLEGIEVDANNLNFSSQDGILYDKAKTVILSVPEAIKGNVIIPDGVKSIDGGMFQNCASLESITIPDSVISIGYAAFAYCTSLKSVTFENTTGWKVSKSSSMSSSRDITVTNDAAQNATLLKYTYYLYFWHRYDN